jgi:hypothetical protein
VRGEVSLGRNGARSFSIYSGRGDAAGAERGRSWRGVSGRRRGKLRCASGRRRLGGASARDGVLNEGLWRASDGGVLAVPRRKVLIMATSTGPPQASGHV